MLQAGKRQQAKETPTLAAVPSHPPNHAEETPKPSGRSIQSTHHIHPPPHHTFMTTHTIHIHVNASPHTWTRPVTLSPGRKDASVSPDSSSKSRSSSSPLKGGRRSRKGKRSSALICSSWPRRFPLPVC